MDSWIIQPRNWGHHGQRRINWPWQADTIWCSVKGNGPDRLWFYTWFGVFYFDFDTNWCPAEKILKFFLTQIARAIKLCQ